MNEGMTSCGNPSHSRYTQGCRCFMCRVANADYSREWAHGNAGAKMAGMRSVGRCRRRIDDLLSHGWTKNGICRAAGIRPTTLRNIVLPDPRYATRKRIDRGVYGRIMALDVDRPYIADGQLVDAQPAANAVRWLVAHGMSVAELSRRTGISRSTLDNLKSGRSKRCMQRTAARLAREAEWLVRAVRS